MSREEFDITEYEFSDNRVKHDGDTLNVTYEQWGSFLDGYSVETLYLDFNKKDAIAMAKHFNLLEEEKKRFCLGMVVCLQEALLDSVTGKCALEDRINLIIKSLEEYEED